MWESIWGGGNRGGGLFHGVSTFAVSSSGEMMGVKNQRKESVLVTADFSSFEIFESICTQNMKAI